MRENGIEIAASGVLMIGFEGDSAESAPLVALEAIAPAGIVLFSRNLSFPDVAVALIEQLRQICPALAWMAIDQEGGRVSRLAKWIGPTPTASQLAKLDPRFCRGLGRATGTALRSLGFNLDFAPVVDLCTAEAPNGIGDRSFGTEPTEVIQCAGQFLSGLQTEQVAGCLKHFPGLGPTALDSHEVLPTVSTDDAELRDRHLRPFHELHSQSPLVMVGHGYYPVWAGPVPRPATATRKIVTGILRNELRFQGLIATDDMEMGAIAPQDETGEMAVATIEAGCDLLLYCKELDRAQVAKEALIRRAEADRAFRERLEDAAARVSGAAAAWPLPVPNRSLWAQAAADFDQLRFSVART